MEKGNRQLEIYKTNAFKPKESNTSDPSFLSVMGVGRR